MSFGRIPELLLAGLIMGALLMVWLWTKTSETTARRVFLDEVAEDGRRTGRLEVPKSLFSAGTPTPPPAGRLQLRLTRSAASSINDQVLCPRFSWSTATENA